MAISTSDALWFGARSFTEGAGFTYGPPGISATLHDFVFTQDPNLENRVRPIALTTIAAFSDIAFPVIAAKAELVIRRLLGNSGFAVGSLPTIFVNATDTFQDIEDRLVAFYNAPGLSGLNLPDAPPG